MSELHYVKVGLQGTFQKSGETSSAPADVDAMIADIERKNADHVAIYIHGGLVDEQAGLKGAERFRDVFSKADAHGLSLVWETGWWETIRKNLDSVFSTELFQEIVKKVVEKVVAHFTEAGGKGGRGPGDGKVEAAAALSDPGKDAALADEARTRARELSAGDLERVRKKMEEELADEIDSDRGFKALYVDPAQRTKKFDDPQQGVGQSPNAPQDKAGVDWISVAAKIARIAWRAGTRFWNGRDHGLHATAVEEVFREFYLTDLFKTLEWDNMKRAARQMWLPNAGLSGVAQHAGTYLLGRLIDLKKRRPGLTVDLVAHSAGAIVVCEMYAAIRAQQLAQPPIRNVIFLAPASTSALFYTNMLADTPPFQDFYMFTMPDDLERRDAVLLPASKYLGFVYPSSLLYVVSGMLEEELDAPLLGMVRYGTGEPPFDSQKLQKIRQYLAAKKERLTLSSAGGPPPAGQLASRATSHGGFSSDQATMDSIQLIIRRSKGK